MKRQVMIQSSRYKRPFNLCLRFAMSRRVVVASSLISRLCPVSDSLRRRDRMRADRPRTDDDASVPPRCDRDPSERHSRRGNERDHGHASNTGELQAASRLWPWLADAEKPQSSSATFPGVGRRGPSGVAAMCPRKH